MVAPPEASRRPLGEEVPRNGPGTVLSSWPVARSQRRTVLSSLVEANVLPSGKQLTVSIGPVCPWRTSSNSPLAAFHNRIDKSLVAAITVLLSDVHVKAR